MVLHSMFHKKFRLTDGREVTFTELKEKDLPEVVSVLNSVIREGVYLTHDEQIVDMDAELEWYRDHMKAGMSYLVARVEDKVVGGASIEPRRGRESHVAVYGIFIKEGFRNLGIGTKLTQALTEIARKRGFKMMELAVLGSNKRAFHVYEKCGFQKVGRIREGVRLPDGSYTDKIIMTLSL